MILEYTAETNAYFHVDAVQAIGHLDVKFDEFEEVDAMSITAHSLANQKVSVHY
ncbi:hypothetical protein ACVXZZ_16140 [Staphylococcus aureus]